MRQPSDEGVWDQLADAGLAFLVERARLGKLTSYTELNATLERRTGLSGFDFGRADERAAMGHLLGFAGMGSEVIRQFRRSRQVGSSFRSCPLCGRRRGSEGRPETRPRTAGTGNRGTLRW